MDGYIEVYINEYRRKDGTFVKAHTRTIKRGRDFYVYTEKRKGKNKNPNQLHFQFTGTTKTNL